MSHEIAGFSKLSKVEKIEWIAKQYFLQPNEAVSIIKNYWNTDEKLQQLHDEFIENTISNFYLPLGIAPNFNIKGINYYWLNRDKFNISINRKNQVFWSWH